MRIRILKPIASIYGGFMPGTVVDIPNENIAASWCRAGIAMQDKSLDGASESKTELAPEAAPAPAKPKTKRKRRKT